MTPQAIQQMIVLGLQHQQAGRAAEAANAYQQILTQHPNHPEALHLLGLVVAQSGQIDAGLELIQRAIAANPSAANYHCNLASVFAGASRFDEAIAAAQKAVSLRPNYPQAMNNLGSALDSVGRSGEAIPILQQAVALAPNSVETLNNLGNALRKKDRNAEAMTVFRRALELRPGEAQTYNNLGSALRKNDQIDEAIAAFERAIAARPDFAEAHNNLGNALRDKGLTDRAISEFRRALELRPNLPHAHNNLAGALEELGHYQQAIDTYRQSIQLRPDHYMAHLNVGIALLRQGDFQQGWPEYEWRCRNPELSEVFGELKSPRWDGMNLDGRRILLQSEQGFGDTIQTVRYAPLVAGRGGRVILRCQPALMRLMQGAEGVEEIVSASDPPPAHDLHCPLLSLPMVFGTTSHNVPAKIPYLKAPDEAVSRYRSRLADEKRPKVGLVWAGRREHANDRNRSIDPKLLQPLLERKDICFISLQKEKTPRPPGELLDWTSELEDFSDTAALVQNLDIVISVDTAVAHLAGAVGTRTWLLLSHVPDWRWLIDRSDSPWYPTMCLFRQPRIGDWETPINQILSELTAAQP